jgi:hypothetical protein
MIILLDFLLVLFLTFACLFVDFTLESLNNGQVLVAHTYNPGYLGG